jgi:hypothetical protein
MLQPRVEILKSRPMRTMLLMQILKASQAKQKNLKAVLTQLLLLRLKHSKKRRKLSDSRMSVCNAKRTSVSRRLRMNV